MSLNRGGPEELVAMGTRIVVERRLAQDVVSLVCAGLMLLASGTGAGAPAPPAMLVSVAIDDAEERASGPGFVTGIRRAFQQDSLMVERAGLTVGRDDLGKVSNRIMLVPRTGSFQLADRSWFRRVTPDSARAAEGEPDSLILIRSQGVIIETSEEMRVFPPGAGGSHPEPPKPPYTWVVTTSVAMCAAGRQADSVEWTQLRARWRERAETWTRAQEIQGWMVGMTAMQLVYRREGWLPDSVDLVFESRGRNR